MFGLIIKTKRRHSPATWFDIFENIFPDFDVFPVVLVKRLGPLHHEVGTERAMRHVFVSETTVQVRYRCVVDQIKRRLVRQSTLIKMHSYNYLFY